MLGVNEFQIVRRLSATGRESNNSYRRNRNMTVFHSNIVEK